MKCLTNWHRDKWKESEVWGRDNVPNAITFIYFILRTCTVIYHDIKKYSYIRILVLKTCSIVLYMIYGYRMCKYGY